MFTGGFNGLFKLTGIGKVFAKFKTGFKRVLVVLNGLRCKGDLSSSWV